MFFFAFNQLFENTATWPIPQKCFPDHSVLHADKHTDYASSWKNERHELFLILEHMSVCIVVFLSSYLPNLGGYFPPFFVVVPGLCLNKYSRLFFFSGCSFLVWLFRLFACASKIALPNTLSDGVSAWTASTGSPLCYCFKQFAYLKVANCLSAIFRSKLLRAGL